MSNNTYTHPSTLTIEEELKDIDIYNEGHVDHSHEDMVESMGLLLGNNEMYKNYSEDFGYDEENVTDF